MWRKCKFLECTFETCVKVENSDFKMDSLQIEKVIDCTETGNDLTVGRVVKIKGGQFAGGLSTNNQCVGRNIRQKSYSKVVTGKNSNILYKKTTPPPGSVGGSTASSTELRVKGHSSHGDEKSPQNLNQFQKKCRKRINSYVRKTDDNIKHELASQTRNIYTIIRMTGSQNNILGILFFEENLTIDILSEDLGGFGTTAKREKPLI